MNRLTIIITASPIKSNPSTKFIDKTIESLSMLKYPENTKIVLAHDFVSSDSQKETYFEYYDKIKEKYNSDDNFIVTMLDKYGHLTGSIRNAFKYVESKYVLLVQHDFPFVRQVDLCSIMDDMDNDERLKHVRFNKRKNIRLGCDGMTGGIDTDIFNNFNISLKNDYISTFMWSDNNHLSPSDYYREVILKECHDRIAMENVIFPRLSRMVNNKESSDVIINTHKKYGTYIYDKIESDRVIYHTDGREIGNEGG